MRSRPFAKLAGASVLAGFTVCSVSALSEPNIAGAATNTVTNCSSSGPGSLQAAVRLAAPGTTITFSVSCRSKNAIKLKKTINIGQDLTIDGPGANSLVVSGSHRSRVFQIASDTNVSMSGLTVKDGSAAGEGGGILNEGNVTLTDVVLKDNTVTTSSGGAFGGGLANEATATVTDSTITKNTATSTGYGAGAGGLYNNNGTLTVTDSVVSDNVADATANGDALGGGIHNGNGTVNVSDTTFSENDSESVTGNSVYGGAISNGSEGISSGTITVTSSTISSNSATNPNGTRCLRRRSE